MEWHSAEHVAKIQERRADSDRCFRSSEAGHKVIQIQRWYTLESYHFEPKHGGLEDDFPFNWVIFRFHVKLIFRGVSVNACFFRAQGTTARRLVVSVSFRQHANDRILAEQKDRGP